MGAVWMRARAELRARWRSWLVLAVLLGVFGGAVTAVAAGARRTHSAYPRFLVEHNAFDIAIADFSVFAPIFWTPDFEALEELPYVVDSARVHYFVGDAERELFGSADPRWGTEFNRARILEGHRPEAADEVLVPFASTSLSDVQVGDVVTVTTISAEDEPIQHYLTVVGRSAAPGDFPPVDFIGDMLVVHPSFVEQNVATSFNAPAIMLKFRAGDADMERFGVDVRQLTGGKTFSPFRLPDQSRSVQRSLDMQAVALWALAGMLALAGVLVLGQALGRQVWLGSQDEDTLAALGMSARARALSHVIVAGAAAAVAAGIASVVAAALSSLFPVGSARVAEPHPGVAFDAVAIGLGVAAVLALGVLAPLPAAIARVRRGQRPAGSARPSFAASLATKLGMSPSAVTGIRLGLEPGRGASAVPVRSTLITIALGLAALIAAFTFGESLEHLLETPRLYGKNWHHVYGFNLAREADASAEVAARDPDVEAVALGSSGFRVEIGGVRLEGMTIEPIAGDILTTPFLEGSFPEGDQILIGPWTRDRLGVRTGDRVPFRVEGLDDVELTVAGVAVLPPIAEGAQFGEGALLRGETLACIVTGRAPGCVVQDPDPGGVDLLVRFRDGLDVPAEIEELRATLVKPDLDQGFFTVEGGDLLNFGRIDDLPAILAAILAVLASAVLAHALVTSIVRRRRDHAILRALGFVRRQVRRSVAWQATSVVLASVAIAVPVGVMAGRWVWVVLANRLGVIVEPRVAWLAVVIAPIAALLAGNLLALLPARAAARSRPAVVLRAE